MGLLCRYESRSSWGARTAGSRSSCCGSRYSPDHSDEGLALYEARHLLLGKKAVPIDIIAKKDINILLISGPNTGGKTVALKTCALIVLMNQFNLGLPVREGSCLPFFDNVRNDMQVISRW